MQPIFVDFAVPSSASPPYAALAPGASCPSAPWSKATPRMPAEGYLSVIDNTVDASTGTIHLKATFDNRDRALWPGSSSPSP